MAGVTVTSTSASTGPDPGGPLVGVCTGHRCAALWAMGSHGEQPGTVWDAPGPQALREAVRSSAGAVLLALECSGVCAIAPVVMVGHRTPVPARSRPPLWVGCADRPGRSALVLEWLARSWAHGMPVPPQGLRTALHRVVVDRRTTNRHTALPDADRRSR